MYAAPVGRVAYWVVRGGLRRVPPNVLSSARRTSQAWRDWGNKFAGVVGRTFGGGLATAAGAYGVAKMPMKRKAPYAERVRAYERDARMYKRVKRSGPRRSVPMPQPPRASGMRKRRSGIVGSRLNVYIKKRGKFNRGKVKRVQPKLMVPYVVERLQVAANANSTSVGGVGALIVSKDNTGLTGVGKMPLYLFDITGCNNTTTNTTNMIRRLTIGDLGLHGWDVINSDVADGSVPTDSCWRTEVGSQFQGSVANAFPYRQIAWLDVRLKLFGNATQQVSFDIMLIRFKRKYLSPNSDPISAQETNLTECFWQSMIRQQIAGDIAPLHFQSLKYVHIIQRKRVTIAAAESTDQNAERNSAVVRMFLRDGKVRNYTENGQRFTTDVSLDSMGWTVHGVNQLTDRPYSEVFLLVRATDYNAVGGEVVTTNASFDVCIRKKTFLYR